LKKKKKKKKRNAITSITRRQIPPPEDNVRYQRGPLPPGWVRYTITIPAGKDRPD